MVKFYISKIKTRTINSNTGEPWKIDDVPKLWRSQVKKELEIELE